MGYGKLQGATERYRAHLELILQIAATGQIGELEPPAGRDIDNFRHDLRTALKATEIYPHEANGRYAHLYAAVKLSISTNKAGLPVILVRVKSSKFTRQDSRNLLAVPGERQSLAVQAATITGDNPVITVDSMPSPEELTEFERILAQRGYELLGRPRERDDCVIFYPSPKEDMEENKKSQFWEPIKRPDVQ